ISRMATWHDLPNEIRNKILLHFCAYLIDDFNLASSLQRAYISSTFRRPNITLLGISPPSPPRRRNGNMSLFPQRTDNRSQSQRGLPGRDPSYNSMPSS